MINKILVPLDASEEAEIIFPYIKELAAKFNSHVDVLGVCIGNRRRRVNRLLKQYIADVVAHMENDGISAKAVTPCGSPADEILKYSEENNIDLVIMATHGRGGITRWWMGSVAEKVISEVSIPVLLIPNKYFAKSNKMDKVIISKILAPLDGSDIGEVALQNVKTVATETKASVTLLNVVLQPGSLELNILGSEFEKMGKAFYDTAVGYLTEISDSLSEEGIDTKHEVLTGDPAGIIVEYAKDNNVSLIAMSTHGRSGIARWMLGSVADKVLHEAAIPMWLVRPSAMTNLERNAQA